MRAELGEVAGRKGATGREDGDGRRGTDVVLYGFGRIGRLLARILIAHTGRGDGLNLRAIVVRKGSDNDLMKRASLLRRDSVHGSFQGDHRGRGREHHPRQRHAHPGHLLGRAGQPWTPPGIEDAIVVDNTGRWRDRDGLSQHLQCPGVSRAAHSSGQGRPAQHRRGHEHLISPAGAGDETILSAASCTTNAIVPVLKAVSDEYGIVGGHVETVRSFTNDQNLIDNFHKGERRGRSAALNMVLTETGAAKAVAKALPELEGKLTGNSIRVPTPNVSMAILNLTLKRPTSPERSTPSCVAPRCTRRCTSSSTTSTARRSCRRTSSAPSTPASSMAARRSPQTTVSCSTSGTTTSSATAVRSSGSWRAWRGSTRRPSPASDRTKHHVRLLSGGRRRADRRGARRAGPHHRSAEDSPRTSWIGFDGPAVQARPLGRLLRRCTLRPWPPGKSGPESA